MTGRFQVLALDGGGVKALFSAGVLADLEADYGVSVRDRFDLIVGTSAGGIIALGLGAGLAPSEILAHVKGMARRVFPARRRYSPARFLQPAYRAEPLRKVLLEILGGRVMADSTKRLVVPAYDVGRGEVYIFKTPHAERFKRDGRVRMVDVALATSAAPTFFPAHVVNGVRLVDGGVWGNNPAVIGFTEAVSVLGFRPEDVRMLSIGTTDALKKHRRRLDRGGWVQWATKATDVVLTASSRGTVGTAKHLLGDRFARFDATVPGGLYNLDRVDIDGLGGLSSGVSRELSPVFGRLFADHTAPDYTPYPQPPISQEEPA